jgi:hypothetical protein
MQWVNIERADEKFDRVTYECTKCNARENANVPFNLLNRWSL